MTTSELTVGDMINLQNLKTLIGEGKVNDGVPRVKMEKKKDGTFHVSLPSVTSADGPTLIDALSTLHDKLLSTYERLSSGEFPLGEHSTNQKHIIESFLAMHVCDCGLSPDNYCYCRGFQCD